VLELGPSPGLVSLLSRLLPVSTVVVAPFNFDLILIVVDDAVRRRRQAILAQIGSDDGRAQEGCHRGGRAGDQGCRSDGGARLGRHGRHVALQTPL
jgi:hypothetical protein